MYPRHFQFFVKTRKQKRFKVCINNEGYGFRFRNSGPFKDTSGFWVFDQLRAVKQSIRAERERQNSRSALNCIFCKSRSPLRSRCTTLRSSLRSRSIVYRDLRSRSPGFLARSAPIRKTHCCISLTTGLHL